VLSLGDFVIGEMGGLRGWTKKVSSSMQGSIHTQPSYL
jgi:hypothetical protein